MDKAFKMGLIRLNEEQWEFVKHYLPEQHMGRPRSRDKECFEAILYKLKTGCQWELLPRRISTEVDGAQPDILLWKKARVFYRICSERRGAHQPAQAVVTHIDSTIRLAKRGPSCLKSRKI